MAFQVRQFDCIQKDSTLDWKFKLTTKQTTQFNYYELDENQRTLLDLSKDISGQMDIQIQNKKKAGEQKNRMVRKSCQNIIKSLKLSLTSFSNDIGEQLDIVKAFFKKQKIPESKYTVLLEKCKRWSISTWLSLDSDNFFKTTQKCMSSYTKDAKKINPDFQHFTELHGIIMGHQDTLINQEKNSQASNLVQIDINLTIKGKYISECLLYNTQNLSFIKTRNFAEHFVDDLIRQNNLQFFDKQTIQQLNQEVRVQIRSQCLYKTLLKKHALTLLNFSTIQIPSQVKQYLIPIDIKLKNDEGLIQYQDYFQWDILNQQNNIEQFCQQLIQDAQLDSKYYSQLCYLIRTQINTQLQWKFMLFVKTYKSIYKDREQPKLNTQTSLMIKKNLPYTMDVQMVPQNKSYKFPQNLSLPNTDVYSLLSRNFDILPEQFQNFLKQKQQKDNGTILRQNSKIIDQTQLLGQKSLHNQQTEQPLIGSSNKIHSLNNKSMSTSKTNLTSLPNMSLQFYQKKGIQIQNNPYLSGINKYQCQNIWKKIISQEKTIIQ